MDSVLVRIDVYDNRIIIDTDGWDNPYRHMCEDPSWTSKDGAPCWWEHLMWSPYKDDRLPLSMIVKYFNDPDADTAWEALRKEREGEEK